MILKNPNWTCKKTLRVSAIIGFVSIIPILSILVGCNARDVVGSKNDMTPLWVFQYEVLFCIRRIYNRSSRQRCSIKTLFKKKKKQKKSQYSQEKACNFMKKRLQDRSFPVNIAKFLRTPSLKNICERLLLL